MVAFPVHVGHGSTVHGDSPGKNTGVGSHALLQGIFPSQGSNRHLLHCRWILYQLESPIIVLLLTKKQNKTTVPKFLAPFPPRDRPLHRTTAHIPQRFVGLPARHASPESPGLWMRGPDSAHWTTGCGKEIARVKGGPASALTKQERAFPSPLKNWHLLWATLTCLFLTGKCGYPTTKAARVEQTAKVPWSTIWCDFWSVGKPFSLALHSHGHLMMMITSF